MIHRQSDDVLALLERMYKLVDWSQQLMNEHPGDVRVVLSEASVVQIRETKDMARALARRLPWDLRCSLEHAIGNYVSLDVADLERGFYPYHLYNDAQDVVACLRSMWFGLRRGELFRDWFNERVGPVDTWDWEEIKDIEKYVKRLAVLGRAFCGESSSECQSESE